MQIDVHTENEFPEYISTLFKPKVQYCHSCLERSHSLHSFISHYSSQEEHGSEGMWLDNLQEATARMPFF